MYDSLAAYYHLIFEDWDASIARQAGILGPLIEEASGQHSARILDAACGIGTQAIGLAQRGHSVTGSDLSVEAVGRARTEVARRKLAVPFHAADLRDLEEVPGEAFDAVLIADNALAHLNSETDLTRAAASATGKLRPGGVVVATIRDYDALVRERPTIQGPAFYGDETGRRIVHQVWDWTAERRYTMHLYLTCRAGEEWLSHHFTSEFHALGREEVTAAFADAGCTGLRWLEPAQSGYYQPVLMGQRPL